MINQKDVMTPKLLMTNIQEFLSYLYYIDIYIYPHLSGYLVSKKLCVKEIRGK